MKQLKPTIFAPSIFALSALTACQGSEAVDLTESATPVAVGSAQSPSIDLPAGAVEDIDFESYSQALATPFGLKLFVSILHRNLAQIWSI